MTTIANLFPNGDVKRLAADWIQLEAVALSKLRGAGLFSTNALFDQRAGQAGDITSVPYLNALSGDSTVGSDDLSSHIVPGNITGDEFLAVRQIRNKAWAGAELAALTTGAKPMQAIINGVAKWRALDEQKVAMAMLNGVYKNADAVSSPADDNLIVGLGTKKLTMTTVIDAGQTKGERKDVLKTLIVHSAVHAVLQKDNLLTTVAPSEQNVGFQTFGEYRLVISDAMTNAAGVYTSILCAPGIINYGEATPDRGAIATVESETAGGGSGGDTLITRRHYIMNIQGYSYVGTANPDNTALATANKYARKLDQALVPFVFIKSALTDS